ncbi:MAG TPA: type II toxin-antitoxin system RelE/ParE family toxin [Bauldia sp.]|nr:type II toxin-antitoxin system RelE/ParE family toxin [Bauldia sp.]
MTVEYARRAAADIAAISEYYDTSNVSVSSRFADHLEELIARLDRWPQSGRPVGQRPGVRVALVPGFPYKLFYRVLNGRIRVLHIRHAARRPLAGR